MLARRDSMSDSHRAIRSDGVASVGWDRVGSRCRESSALKTGRRSGVRGSSVAGAGIVGCLASRARLPSSSDETYSTVDQPGFIQTHWVDFAELHLCKLSQGVN